MSMFCTSVTNGADCVACTYLVKGERSCFTYLSRKRRDVFRALSVCSESVRTSQGTISVINECVCLHVNMNALKYQSNNSRHGVS